MMNILGGLFAGSMPSEKTSRQVVDNGLMNVVQAVNQAFNPLGMLFGTLPLGFGGPAQVGQQLLPMLLGGLFGANQTK